MNFITLTGDLICDMCIFAMQYLSEITTISYGTINVLFFIILQPLAILCFFISTISSVIYNKIKNNIFKVVGIISVIIGILSVLAVLIPVIYAFWNMPYPI